MNGPERKEPPKVRTRSGRTQPFSTQLADRSSRRSHRCKYGCGSLIAQCASHQLVAQPERLTYDTSSVTRLPSPEILPRGRRSSQAWAHAREADCCEPSTATIACTQAAAAESPTIHPSAISIRGALVQEAIRWIRSVLDKANWKSSLPPGSSESACPIIRLDSEWRSIRKSATIIQSRVVYSAQPSESESKLTPPQTESFVHRVARIASDLPQDMDNRPYRSPSRVWLSRSRKASIANLSESLQGVLRPHFGSRCVVEFVRRWMTADRI